MGIDQNSPGVWFIFCQTINLKSEKNVFHVIEYNDLNTIITKFNTNCI